MSSLLFIKTASSFCIIAPFILTPFELSWFILKAALSKSIFSGTSAITSLFIKLSSISFKRTDTPTPTPIPPGVEGLWPIIVDSVIIVSVIVSMATSPITGAASFILISESSSKFLPVFSNSLCKDW